MMYMILAIIYLQLWKIDESWPIYDSKRKNKVNNWSDLYEYNQYPEGLISNMSSLLRFRGHIQRIRKSSLFVDKRKTSIYLGNHIKRSKRRMFMSLI